MRVEIDQSVKIERTNRDTALGIANGTEFAVIIPAKVKRRLQEEFRRQGKPRLFILRTFMAGVVLALHYAKVSDSSSVTIDVEYPGQETLLRSMFLEMWSRFSAEIPVLEFSRVGKRSEAHRVSNHTAIGRRQPERELSYEEIRQLALK